MRRFCALILAVLILASNGLPTGANTSQLKYADWEFNQDFTSVRVGEPEHPGPTASPPAPHPKGCSWRGDATK